MTEQTTGRPQMTPEVRRAIVQWIVQSALGMIGYGVLLFVAAGTVRWPWGWVLLALLTAFMAGHVVLLVPINPELLAEREKGVLAKGVKTWDKWIAMLGGGVLPIVSWLLAALEYSWRGEVLPLAWHLLGVVVSVAGYGLFLWALRANAFFAEGVRIQEERGHTVASGGPYRYVRHPGYVGAILGLFGAPLVLGSVRALIPAVGAAALYVLRTYLEDRTLTAELPGYREYTHQTRYRLLPGVW